MKLNDTRKALPNLFTFANMTAGFVAIIFATQNRFVEAAWLIFAAGILDALDGFVARLVKGSSKFGVELDSLADLLSFAMAPSFIIYLAEFNRYGYWGILLSASFLFCGAFRLARFNAELKGMDKTMFYGLPTPMAAMTLMMAIVVFTDNGNVPESLALAAVITHLALAVLMVSRVQYDPLPRPSMKDLKQKPQRPAFLLTAVVVALFAKATGLFYIFVFYIVFGIFRQVVRAFTGGTSKESA